LKAVTGVADRCQHCVAQAVHLGQVQILKQRQRAEQGNQGTFRDRSAQRPEPKIEKPSAVLRQQRDGSITGAMHINQMQGSQISQARGEHRNATFVDSILAELYS
jgi:predicted FMN-binding regulatory protein PaiB